MYELQVFFYCWGLTVRIKPMNPKQFGGPVLEASSVECPATHMRKTLSLPEIKLCLFPIFNVEIDPDPIPESPIAGAHGLSATQKPAKSSFSVTHAKTHLT